MIPDLDAERGVMAWNEAEVAFRFTAPKLLANVRARRRGCKWLLISGT